MHKNKACHRQSLFIIWSSLLLQVRIEALKSVRSLLLAGADGFDEMYSSLKVLELAFQSSVKDLRSQVVREACITIAYMSQQLKHRVDRFLEALMQSVINLIQVRLARTDV